MEPFAGSAAVFWYKEPAEHEYINDLDKDMIEPLKLLKKAPADPSAYPNLKGQEAVQRYYDAPGSGVVNKLTKAILRQCNGFSGVRVSDKSNKLYRPSNPYAKFKRIGEYKARIKDAHLSSMDYATLIKKHDGKNTFIFMDPPYENSKDLEYAQGTDFDFERYAQVVRGLKSNWMITINDSPRIRELFSGYHIQPVIIEGVGNRHLGAKPRKELIITNYALPRGWKDEAPPGLKV